MIHLNSHQPMDHEADLSVPAMLAMLQKIEAETSSDLIMEPVASVLREAIVMLTDLRQIAYEAMLEADTEWLALEGSARPSHQKLC